MTAPFSARLTRRGFLTAAGVAAAAPWLASCSSDTGGAPTGGAGDVALPDYIPLEGAPADLAGDLARGINPGYLAYPADRVRAVEATPGSGAAMSAFVISFSPPPPPKTENAYWQAIDEALGVDLQPTLVPQEFATKLAAMLTGGDIPDLVTMYLGDAASVRRFPDVAAANFADLSEFLGGDAIAAYPNLARLPEASWPSTVFNGAIYATPTLRVPTGAVTYLNPSVLERLDVDPQPRDLAGFEEMCRALTDPDENRWAMSNGSTSWMGALIGQLFRVPNNWRLEDDGSLTKNYETEEWKESIAFTAKLWEQGYFHPDSPTDQGPEGDQRFQAGTTAIYQDSFVRYTVRADASFTPSIMRPFAHDGGDAIQYEGAVTDFVTFVKKGDRARVEECLRVLDFLNAPFGSEEHFLRTYGVEGADHTIVDGQPVLTDQGANEVPSLCLRFIGGGPDVLYASNGNTPVVEDMHAFQGEVAERRVLDPTAGVYAAASAGSINQIVTDTVTDVVLGRKPVSALDEAVASWRSEGGDEVRSVYEEAIAARS